MTAELINIIGIMNNVAIIGINGYSRYKTVLKAKELGHQLIIEHPKQQRAVEDFQNFLRAAGKVTAIVGKRIETDISEISDFDGTTFTVLIHLKERKRATFLDFRSSLKIDLSHPDAGDTCLDGLISDMNKQSFELDKKLRSHRNHYYSLFNNCAEIARDYINVRNNKHLQL